MKDQMMQAVVYRENGLFTLEQRPVPEMQEAGDAIVRVTLSSICSSDLHIKHGSVPRAKPGVIVEMCIRDNFDIIRRETRCRKRKDFAIPHSIMEQIAGQAPPHGKNRLSV